MYHRLRSIASPVLIATGFVNGRGQSLTPQNPHPLTDHQKLKKLCCYWLHRRPLWLCQIWCRSIHSGLLGQLVQSLMGSQCAKKCAQSFSSLSGITEKKLSYRRGTTRCVVSVEILLIAVQQCRNCLYDKSWTNRSYEVGGLRWADV